MTEPKDDKSFNNDAAYHMGRLDSVAEEIEKRTVQVLAGVSAGYAVLFTGVATTLAKGVFDSQAQPAHPLPLELFILMIGAILGLGGCLWLYVRRQRLWDRIGVVS